MAARRRRLFLALAVAAGCVAVGVLPRPPDTLLPPTGEGWSPRPAGSGEAPHYPSVRDVAYRGAEPWAVGSNSTLIWTLGAHAQVTLRYSLQGELSIDRLRLDRSGGPLAAAAPEIQPRSVGDRFAAAFEPTGPFELSFPDEGTLILPPGAGIPVWGRLQGALGPAPVDLRLELAVSQPSPETLRLQGSVLLEPGIHEWGAQWRALRTQLDSLDAGSGTTTVQLTVELTRPPP